MTTNCAANTGTQRTKAEGGIETIKLHYQRQHSNPLWLEAFGYYSNYDVVSFVGNTISAGLPIKDYPGSDRAFKGSLYLNLEVQFRPT